MSNTINKVILVGHLGRNPEVKTFDNGGKIANFSMATKEIWKDRKENDKNRRSGTTLLCEDRRV
jgi:single-strand DNA-binding protein